MNFNKIKKNPNEKVFVVDGLISNPLKSKTNRIKSDNFVLKTNETILPQDDKNTLQGILRLPIIVAQCCGLFPVCGIGSTSASDLRFKWIAWRTLFSIFCISGNVCMAVFFFYWIAMRGLKLENMGLFYY